MAVGIRDLARKASQIVEQVGSTGRPALITRRGKPVAALIPIDESELEDWILSNAPEFVRSMRQADREIARGERGRPLDEVLAQIEAEHSSSRPRSHHAGT